MPFTFFLYKTTMKKFWDENFFLNKIMYLLRYVITVPDEMLKSWRATCTKKSIHTRDIKTLQLCLAHILTLKIFISQYLHYIITLYASHSTFETKFYSLYTRWRIARTRWQSRILDACNDYRRFSIIFPAKGHFAETEFTVLIIARASHHVLK